MKIQTDAMVAIDYTLKLDSGEEVDKSEPGQPLKFLFGRGQIIPGLERQLDGLEVGATAELTVEADDGYGPRRDELVRELPRKNFPEDVELKPGMIFQGMGPRGPIPVRIKEAGDEQVLVDFNHPLAGERLHFDVKVAEVREATEAELGCLGDSGCASCGGGCG